MPRSPRPDRPRRLPRTVAALLADFATGFALGLGFLAVLAVLDPMGLARQVLALPPVAALAVVLGGALPFATGFAATGLDWRSAPDAGD